MTLTVPTNNMQGQWIDPASGTLLKTITRQCRLANDSHSSF